MTRALQVLLLGLVVACATLGDETAFPEVVQTSGVGPFRLLETIETGGRAIPNGRILQTNEAVGRSMIAEGILFYAAADPLDEPPDRDPTLPEGVLDLAQLGPRRIFRGLSDVEAAEASGDPEAIAEAEGTIGFDPGSMLLEATEAWEGPDVFDPWVLVTDGGARLYYAAEGGLGLAEASGADGAYTKVAGPLIPDARAPAAVTFGGETLLFFEATDTGGLGLARSSDGRTFTEETRDLDVGLAGETALAAPGAVVATTPTGRTLVRLYFEAVDAEGIRHITLAATEDAVTWERLETGILDSVEDARAPTPYLLPDDVTLLVITRERNRSGVQVRAVAGTVAPASVVLVEEPPPETM